MTDNGPDGGLRNTIYRQQTRSGRRMSFWRRAAYALAAPLALLLIRGLWAMCRSPRVIGEQHLRAALADGGTLIPCYWHQHQVFCAWYLLRQAHLGLRAGFLISPSVDGELGAMIVRRVGGHVVRGSSTYTGARALRDFMQALTRDGISPAITPDGPRGPAFEFKAGAILLAQMSGRPMLPMAWAASRATLVQWDRFVIPWPLARIAIAIGEPRYVPRKLDVAALEAEQRFMAARLRALFAEARAGLAAA
ncbi:MAG: lysophospholipid acyltransferase family protein [Steroidobacteraceae bacterium]